MFKKFERKTELDPSEYKNLFGDPFTHEGGSLKARQAYSKMSDKEKAEMLKANYIKMIKKSRERNFNMAADCLQWWLDGTGSTKNIDFHWLRNQREVISAEDVNLERFEKDQDSKFIYFLELLIDEVPGTFTTFYDRQVKAGIFGELYYASNHSILSSRCHFRVTKKKNNYILSGNVTHKWRDKYDWHKGADAYIPSFGYVDDSDALLVEKYCGAKPFDMRSEWQQNFNKTFQINSGNINLKIKDDEKKNIHRINIFNHFIFSLLLLVK